MAGHLTPDLVIWLFHHGVMSLDTPLSGSWLTMAEAGRRIIVYHASLVSILRPLNKSLSGSKTQSSAEPEANPYCLEGQALSAPQTTTLQKEACET
ncbi:MAG TPA: hypothetical protein VFN35_14975 [Ktedonobacteraceae bacterium]|nr:hypothetical protein [Ktedonobacteraceae bacterium]